MFQYEEMFSSALAGYSRAAALDPSWEEPTEREKLLLKYLDQITSLMENKVSVVKNVSWWYMKHWFCRRFSKCSVENHEWQQNAINNDCCKCTYKFDSGGKAWSLKMWPAQGDIIFLWLCPSGKSKNTAAAQHALHPERVCFGSMCLTSVLLPDRPHWKPGALHFHCAYARP